MTRGEAIKRIKEHIDVHRIGYYPHIKLREALNMAIAALRKQEEREKPEPLTLDELRQMDGQPVWLETGEVSIGEQICGSWEIFIRREYEFYCFTRRKKGFWAENYGKTWLAYRNKPKEVT